MFNAFHAKKRNCLCHAQVCMGEALTEPLTAVCQGSSPAGAPLAATPRGGGCTGWTAAGTAGGWSAVELQMRLIKSEGAPTKSECRCVASQLAAAARVRSRSATPGLSTTCATARSSQAWACAWHVAWCWLKVHRLRPQAASMDPVYKTA